MRSEDAAECVEFKEERPSSGSLGTDGTSVESVPRGAQAPWLVESSAPPQEEKAEVESKPSVWYTGAGGERLQPEEHTGNVVEDKRLYGEEGAGNSHAVPGEAGTQSSFPSPAADAAPRDVPILDRANPGPGLLEPVSLVPQQRQGQPGAERTAHTEPGGREGEPGDQSSSHAGIQSRGGNAILPEEHREDGSAQQNSEE